MKQRSIEIVTGKTGTGKSYFVKNTLLKEYPRKIIIDAMLEYEGGLIFFNFDSLIDYIIENELYRDSEFTLICRFTSDYDIEQVFYLAERLTNVCLVVEEAERYISPYTKFSQFLQLVNYGRHWRISIIAVARRTVELSNTLRSQVNSIYSFLQTDPNDLKMMSNFGFTDIDQLNLYEYRKIDY